MKKNLALWALLATILIPFLLTSCPAAPPLAPTDGFQPYLAPETPSELKVSNGYRDTISLSWKAVEGATSYMVWATEADQYGTTTQNTVVTETYSKLLARGFELIDIVTEPSCKLSNLEVNTSYIFSIIAMKTMERKGSNNTVLYSEPSNFAQGSTIGEITLSAVANSKTVTLFWDISNLYSVLDNSKERLSLYDYKLSIYKKLNSSNDWGEAKVLDSNTAKTQTFSFGASSLEIDTLYDFKIRLEVLNSDNEVITSIESTPFTLTTDTSPTPESVENITATSGLTRKEVTLTWTAPALSNHDNIKSVFIIQRAETAGSSSAGSSSGTLTWTEIIAPVTHNEDGTYSVTDSTLADNTTYTYRILNGYQLDTKTPVYQEAEDAATIQKVYALWIPQDIIFTFAKSTDLKTGTLTASYTYNPPKTHGTVKCYVGGTTWTELDLSKHTQLEEKEGNSLEVSIENEKPLNYYSFYFKFTLDDQEVLTVTHTDETLGITGATTLLSDFKATEDWVQAIRLSWKEITALDDTYKYEIYQDNDNSPLTDCEIVSSPEDSTLKSVLLNTDTSETHSYRIKVSNDSTFAVVETTGQALARPTGLSATDGTSKDEISVTWPQLDDDKLKYSLKYSYDGITWKDLTTTTTGTTGQATLAAQGEGKDGNKVSFKLIVSNTEQTEQCGLAEDKTLESEVETGSVLGPALLNVKIENDGLDPDKITIKWDKVDGADHYKIKRNDEYLEWEKDADTYSDKVSAIKALGGEAPLNATYTYTVIPCLEDGTEAVIGSCEEAKASGKLFAPPKNLTASKGQSTITLTWDSIEKAAAYEIQKYTLKEVEGEISKTKIGEPVTVSAGPGASQTYEETNDSLLKETVLYEICSVLEDGTTTSQWQTYYYKVKNALGFDEAANIGYTLADVAKLDAKTANLNAEGLVDGFYEDYVIVTWSLVPGATSYELTSYTGSKEWLATTTIQVNEISSYSETDVTDNGKAGPGYLSYDPSNKLYTYYDGNGLFKDSYEITSYEIKALNGTTVSNTTSRNTKVYRQPNGSYWVNPILNILKPAFKAANSSFSGDWWIQGTTGNSSYTYNSGMQFELYSVTLSGTYYNDKNYLKITSYKDTAANLTLETTANIQFAATDSGAAGYLGNDPLKTIGYGGNGTISVTTENANLRPFTIKFTDINVNSASGGSYTVTINGREYVTPDSSDFIRVLGD